MEESLGQIFTVYSIESSMGKHQSLKLHSRPYGKPMYLLKMALNRDVPMNVEQEHGCSILHQLEFLNLVRGRPQYNALAQSSQDVMRAWITIFRQGDGKRNKNVLKKRRRPQQIPTVLSTWGLEVNPNCCEQPTSPKMHRGLSVFQQDTHRFLGLAWMQLYLGRYPHLKKSY